MSDFTSVAAGGPKALFGGLFPDGGEGPAGGFVMPVLSSSDGSGHVPGQAGAERLRRLVMDALSADSSDEDAGEVGLSVGRIDDEDGDGEDSPGTVRDVLSRGYDAPEPGVPDGSLSHHPVGGVPSTGRFKDVRRRFGPDSVKGMVFPDDDGDEIGRGGPHDGGSSSGSSPRRRRVSGVRRSVKPDDDTSQGNAGGRPRVVPGAVSDDVPDRTALPSGKGKQPDRSPGDSRSVSPRPGKSGRKGDSGKPRRLSDRVNNAPKPAGAKNGALPFDPKDPDSSRKMVLENRKNRESTGLGKKGTLSGHSTKRAPAKSRLSGTPGGNRLADRLKSKSPAGLLSPGGGEGKKKGLLGNLFDQSPVGRGLSTVKTAGQVASKVKKAAVGGFVAIMVIMLMIVGGGAMIGSQQDQDMNTGAVVAAVADDEDAQKELEEAQQAYAAQQQAYDDIAANESSSGSTARSDGDAANMESDLRNRADDADSGDSVDPDGDYDLYQGKDNGGGDAGVANLSKRQLENFTVAYNRAKKEGLSEKGVLSVVTVVLTETNGWNFANDGSGGQGALGDDQDPAELRKSMDHPQSDGLPSDHGLGHGGDHGSVGIIQQQFPWWGTIDELMDRSTAAYKFIEKFKDTDYENQSIGLTVQSVQRSFDASGSNYERVVPTAKEIMKKIQENEGD